MAVTHRASSRSSGSAGAHLMSNLDLYFQEVKMYGLLTRDEECELARGIHANDNAALHKLVKANLRFVVSIAKEYAHYGVPLEDLGHAVDVLLELDPQHAVGLHLRSVGKRRLGDLAGAFRRRGVYGRRQAAACLPALRRQAALVRAGHVQPP